MFFQIKMTALISCISSQQVNWGRSVEVILPLRIRVKAKYENCGDLWMCLMIFNLADKNIQHNLFNTERKAEFASMTWFADFISVRPCQCYLPPNFTIILVIWNLELISEPNITKKTWKPVPLSAKICNKQSAQTSGLHVSSL